MTTSPDEPQTLQGMLEWLEGELRQVKAQGADTAEEGRQNRSQIWEVADQVQRAEAGAVNLTAQIDALSGLPEEIRNLREHLQRIQAALGSDRMELFARQLRTEMQAERDERSELRRRAEFAEQAAANLTEKLTATEELGHRLQDHLTILQQRLEQGDINAAGIDARVAANAEAARRLQMDERTLGGDVERHDRTLGEVDERLGRLQETLRRVEEGLARFEEMEREVEAIRERLEATRQATDGVVDRAAAAARDHESLLERATELERGLERARAQTGQQDRSLADLRATLDEARKDVARENERFLTLQEKLRRRQIADLEQEIREMKGYGRLQPNA